MATGPIVVTRFAATQVSVVGSGSENGPYRLNVIPPVAVDVAPVSVAVSLIGSPSVTDAVALVVSEVQLLIDTCSGAMKSLISAVKESEERLFRYAEPKLLHVFEPKRAPKVMDASP